MKLPKFKKKVVVGALAAGLVMGAGGIAAAYFTAGGSGSASATVGNSVPLSVTQTTVYYLDATSNGSTDGVNALYPTGTAQPVFKIRNLSHAPEQATWSLSDFSIVTSGSTIAATKTGTNPVTGCKAAWFNLSPNGTSTGSATLQAGAPGDTPTPSGSTSAIASVDLNMTNGTTATNGTNQNACEGHTPIVTLSFNS